MASASLPTPRTAPKPHIWEPVKLWRRRVAAKIMRARVKNRDFTIISNDCFGGMAYEELGLRYSSPFVGLFILPEDYVRLLRNLKPACEQPIRFREHSRHERINVWRQNIIRRDYPIGVVGDDVEVHFLHYAEREAAGAKWTRRAKRIHWDNLLVKICWHEEENMALWLREFDAMPFASKLCLVPHEIPGVRSSVVLRNYGTDGTWQYWSSHLHFDVAAWLNTGVVNKRPWSDWLLYWHY